MSTTLNPQPVNYSGLHQRLDGGSCLNQRSILLACEIFGGKGAPNGDLKLSELLEALWVLELMIVSKNISYDGTLPVKDLEQLTHATEDLMSGTKRVHDMFGPIAPDNPDEQFKFVVGAAAKALEDLSGPEEAGNTRAPQGPTKGLDEEFPESDTGKLFGTLRKLHERGTTGNGDVVMSQEERDHWLGAGFRGSKCVVGLAGLGPASVQYALELPERLGISAALAAGMLVNRFRFTYVRQLSFGAQDVYVPAARWKPLSQLHTLTFAEAAREHFQELYGGNFTREARERLEAEFGGDDRTLTLALPPIGLYALMRAKPKSGPKGVLLSALEEFSHYGQLFRFFWEKTREVAPPAGGWIVLTGNDKLDAVSAPIGEFLTNELGKLEDAALGPKSANGSKLERYVTPIVDVGVTVAGMATDAAATAAGYGFKSKLAGKFVGWGLKKLYAKHKERLIGHIDEYRSLDAKLLRAYMNQIRLDRVGAKVEQVLGRRLV